MQTLLTYSLSNPSPNIILSSNMIIYFKTHCKLSPGTWKQQQQPVCTGYYGNAFIGVSTCTHVEIK